MWESHADSDIRRVSNLGPDTVFPTYVVSDLDGRVDDLRVAAVATPQSTPDQVEGFFHRLLANAATQAATPKPKPSAVDQLLSVWWGKLRLGNLHRRRRPDRRDWKLCFKIFFLGIWPPVWQSRPGPIRWDWNAVVCFSCGKAGHSANRLSHFGWFFPFHAAGMVSGKCRGWLCDDFILGGSRASPSGKRRLIREGGSPPGSVIMFDPRTQGGGGGDATQTAAPPRDGVAAWTGAPPLSARGWCHN